MPSNKIMMGQNLYGYDWTLPFVQGTVAKAVSPQQAIELAAQQQVPIQYDTKAQALSSDTQQKMANSMRFGLRMPAPFKQSLI